MTPKTIYVCANRERPEAKRRKLARCPVCNRVLSFQEEQASICGGCRRLLALQKSTKGVGV
ncbi:MAG: hypothetical protein WCP12_17295 [bacterium]